MAAYSLNSPKRKSGKQPAMGQPSSTSTPIQQSFAGA